MNAKALLGFLGQKQEQPLLVRVPGRDDVGEVIEEGLHVGLGPRIECLGIHFPATGQYAYYDRSRVEAVESTSQTS